MSTNALWVTLLALLSGCPDPLFRLLSPQQPDAETGITSQS